MATLLEQNAARMKALGHPVRLAIVRLIVQGHQEGTPAGEIQEHVGIPASTLSHHLACLAETDLVLVEREGTTLRYRAHFEVLHKLTQYLWEDCCKGGRACEDPRIHGAKCCTPAVAVR
jgi:DNA-binding transcriptional ArsR family regulator